MRLCSELNTQIFNEYFQRIRDNSLHGAIQLIYQIYDTGYSVVDIYDYLFSFVKVTDILQENEKYLLISLFCTYITIFYRIHEDPIELAIFTNRIYLILHNSEKRIKLKYFYIIKTININMLTLRLSSMTAVSTV